MNINWCVYINTGCLYKIPLVCALCTYQLCLHLAALVNWVQVYTGLCMQTSQSLCFQLTWETGLQRPEVSKCISHAILQTPHTEQFLPGEVLFYYCLGHNQVETDLTLAGHRASACRGWDRQKRDRKKEGGGSPTEKEGTSDAVPRAEVGNILDFTTQAIKHIWISMTES